MTNTQDRGKFFRELIDDPQPAQWRELSLGDVVAARVWHKQQIREEKTIAGIVWAVFAGPGLYFAATESPLILLGVFFGSLLWLAISAAFIGASDGLGRCLDPLKEHPKLCKEALKYVENPNVAAYRDAVVARGRELLAGDVDCMEAIFENLDTDRTCRILHGLEQPAA